MKSVRLCPRSAAARTNTSFSSAGTRASRRSVRRPFELVSAIATNSIRPIDNCTAVRRTCQATPAAFSSRVGMVRTIVRPAATPNQTATTGSPREKAGEPGHGPDKSLASRRLLPPPLARFASPAAKLKRRRKRRAASRPAAGSRLAGHAPAVRRAQRGVIARVALARSGRQLFEELPHTPRARTLRIKGRGEDG